jgi:hypothetical protein
MRSTSDLRISGDSKNAYKGDESSTRAFETNHSHYGKQAQKNSETNHYNEYRNFAKFKEIFEGIGARDSKGNEYGCQSLVVSRRKRKSYQKNKIDNVVNDFGNIKSLSSFQFKTVVSLN